MLDHLPGENSPRSFAVSCGCLLLFSDAVWQDLARGADGRHLVYVDYFVLLPLEADGNPILR